MKPATLPLANALCLSALCLLLSALCLPALSAPEPAAPQENPQADSQKKIYATHAIITEMTDAGRALPEPIKTRLPVYYLSHSKEQRNFGDVSVGTKRITYSFLRKQLATAFASNGSLYRSADKEHPPTQVFYFEWGVCDEIKFPGASAKNSGGNPDAGKVANTSFRDNLIARAELVGGKKFAGEFVQALMENDMKRFATRDDPTLALIHAIFNGCYYLRVSSCDFEAHKKNQKKLLWSTTVTALSRELSFDAALPVLIQFASIFSGLETVGHEIVRPRTGGNKRGIIATISEETVAAFISHLPLSTSTPALQSTDTTPPKP